MLDWLLGLIDEAQGAIFEHALQPALYQLGLMGWSDELFDGVGFALFGALEIVLAYILLRPLEWWRPVERWSDRQAVRTDVVYSLVHRLGVVPAILFLLLTPIAAMIEGTLRFQGFIPATLEQLIPPLLGWPFVTFLLYVVVIDFARILAAPAAAPAAVVVGLAQPAPRPAADDLVGGRPQPCARRCPDLGMARHDRAVDRGRAGRISAGHDRLPAGREPVAHQCATPVRLARHRAAGRAAIPSAAPFDRACAGAVRPHDGLQFRGDPAGVGHPVRHLAARPRVFRAPALPNLPAPRSAAATCGISSKASAGSAPSWRGWSTAAVPVSSPPCRARGSARKRPAPIDKAQAAKSPGMRRGRRPSARRTGAWPAPGSTTSASAGDQRRGRPRRRPAAPAGPRRPTTAGSARRSGAAISASPGLWNRGR